MKRFILIGAMVLSVAAANAQLTIVDNIGGAWMDISGTGTPLSLGDDAAVDITMTVSNAVFGAGTVRVGSNGGVRFGGSGLNLSFSNQTIPSNSAFSGDQTLLPFWDDIDTDGGNFGEIYWQEIGNTLIVQWNEVFFWPNDPVLTMQVQVHGSGPGFAQFLYRDVSSARADNGGSATIGYQNGGAGFNDVQWSFNDDIISNGDVLTLVPEPASMIALGAGLVALAARRRRKKAA